MSHRFWSDNFDMDLLKILPGLPEWLGDAADIPMWTRGAESYGRLNHPSVWNDPVGFVAFFGLTAGDTGKPGANWTDSPVVECTWLEVLRDAWPHGYAIVVDGQTLWNAGRWQNAFLSLMYDLRGQQKMPDGHADRARLRLLGDLLTATRALRTLKETT